MTDGRDGERISRAAGKRPVTMVPAGGHGAPSNRRWIVSFADGSTAFAKIAAFDYTADWLRLERTNYEALDAHGYLPRLLGWHDDGESPTLLLEDLSRGRWPPPWTPESIEAVQETLRQIQATSPPDVIRELFGEMFDIRQGWLPLRADPAEALALDVFDEPWLDANGDTLAGAAERPSSPATRSCTAMSAATISACSMGAPSWWIGTGPVAAPPCSISLCGCRACTTRAGRRRGKSCPDMVHWPP